MSKAWARTTVSYGVARSTTTWGIPAYLAIGVLIFLVIVFMYALTENLQLMHRWLDRPYLVMFPAISAAAAVVLGVSVRRRRNEWPFYRVTLIFVSAFGTLTISLWPYMIPFVLTIGQLQRLTPVFISCSGQRYSSSSYRVFRGKIKATAAHY